MINPITKEMLEKMTTKQRMTIYENARATNSPQADDIIEMLFKFKLLDRVGGGLSRDHITIQKIEQICRSPHGIEAAMAAAHDGQAPMAGVDPILKNEIREYGYFDTTSWAGGFVAEELEACGWTQSGRKTLPATCVAKTAAFFLPPPSEYSEG